LMWLATFSLAIAANETRWHQGGYATGWIAIAWHLSVFAVVATVDVFLGRHAANPAFLFRLGAELFVVVALLVLFGYNALQLAIALADLVRKDDRVVLRRVFAQLERSWVDAEIPNVIAMVSAHPKLYQLIGLGVDATILIHASYLLVGMPFTARTGIELMRDIVLIVFVQWQVQWYAATYYQLRRLILPER